MPGTMAASRLRARLQFAAGRGAAGDSARRSHGNLRNDFEDLVARDQGRG